MKFHSADEFFKQCGDHQVVLRHYDSTGTYYDASVMITLEELFQHFAVRSAPELGDLIIDVEELRKLRFGQPSCTGAAE